MVLSIFRQAGLYCTRKYLASTNGIMEHCQVKKCTVKYIQWFPEYAYYIDFYIQSIA